MRPVMVPSAATPSPSKALVFVRRLGSTLLLWGLVGATFASMRAWAYLGLIALLTLVSTLEIFRMAGKAGVSCCGRFGLILTAIYCAILHADVAMGRAVPQEWEMALVGLCLCGAFVIHLRVPVRGIDTLTGVMTTAGAFVYVAVLFNFTSKLLFFLPEWRLADGKVAMPAALLVLWLLAVTKFSDMGAYLTGSVIGRHKMIPHISPAKTWEGFAGGLAFSQLAGCGLYALFPQHFAVFGGWGHVVLLGFVLGVLAVIGDLAESVVKRALGAKDSGQMLPGIGGALDLIDSICFTAPVLYFYLHWVRPAIA